MEKKQTDEFSKIVPYLQGEVAEKDIFTFSLLLCDNEVDRDLECFPLPSLHALAPLFVGKTGILDHKAEAAGQAARIFHTWVEENPFKKTSYGEPYAALKARAYMVRHEGNRDFIAEISAGIKKEVSIGCRMEKKVCSRCGADVAAGFCGHQKGSQWEKGQVCHLLLHPLDAYEWSFVAVPAQRAAGVIKAYGDRKGKGKVESGEIKNSMPGQKELQKLQQDAAFGAAYRKKLMEEVLRLSLLKTPDLPGKVLWGICEKLEPQELVLFQKVFCAKEKETPLSQFGFADKTEEQAPQGYEI